uniref:Uncharacterized protein n=1 Tax=Rhizophora mucronata TaxID=61149 RepID=A0A2P2Q608_RHIMU
MYHASQVKFDDLQIDYLACNLWVLNVKSLPERMKFKKCACLTKFNHQFTNKGNSLV